MRQCSSAPLTSMLLVEGSSRACGRQQVAQKDRTIRGDEFARTQPVEDLTIAVALIADLHCPSDETAAIRRNPDGLRAIAFANHAVEGNCGRTNRRADSDDKICEHARAQFVLRVFDLGANE